VLKIYFSFQIFSTHHHKKNQNNAENEWSPAAKQIEDGLVEAVQSVKK